MIFESEGVRAARNIVNKLVVNGVAQKTTEGLVIVNRPENSGYITIGKTDNSTLYISR